MASITDTVTLPAPSQNQTYVSISALQAGHLTIPENLFVTDADPEKRTTVPCLSFLIHHPSSRDPSTDNLLFDLGIKRDFSGYREAQQKHISQRQPTAGKPDVAESLAKGGFDAQDVGTVILSHVHWDHVGTPGDFSKAQFIVGSGTLDLLANGGGPLYPAEIFNPEELPRDRTRELPPVREDDNATADKQQTSHKWAPLAGFPAALDFYGDGSLYVVDSPGHLKGHVNLLARVAPKKWVYLGGDFCHDHRILSGEKEFALYDDGRGGLRSVHADTNLSNQTVERIRRLTRKGMVREEGGDVVEVEVVLAHDRVWAERNEKKFWPSHL